MINSKTITQNTTYYTAALIFQKILAFIYFTFLARGLGVEDLGKYTFAFSFTTIFSVLVDVGLSSVLTREVAKHQSNDENILGNVIGLKVILSLVVYGAIFLIINLLGYPTLTKNLVYLTGAIMLLDNFSTTFWAVLRGHQNLKFESLGITFFQIIVFVVGLTFLYFRLGVIWQVVAMMFASSFNCLYSGAEMTRRLRLKIKTLYDKNLLKHLLKISIPFALTGIFARLNTQIDTVFLSKIGCGGVSTVCDTNVGLYSVPVKIVLAIHFIPLAFVAAIFPAMSKFFVEDKEKLARLFEKSMKYLMIISLPIAMGIGVLAPDFMPKIFGPEFSKSVNALRILMISLVFIFLTFPIGSLLNSISRQLRNTFNTGMAVLVNIILNLWWIPIWKYDGAAAASAISAIIMLVLGWRSARQSVKFRGLYLFKTFLQCLFSASMTGIILNVLLYKLHFAILIILGALIYFAILFIIGGFRKSEVTDLLIKLHVIQINKI